MSSDLARTRLYLTRPPSSVGLSVPLAPVALEPEAGAVKAIWPLAGFTSESVLSVAGSFDVSFEAFCVVQVEPSGAVNFRM